MKDYLIKEKVIDGYVSFPTQLLFDLYDEKRAVIVYNEKDEGMYITPLDFSYKDDLEYTVSKFKWEKTEENSLTAFAGKLLDVFHHSWYNRMSEFLHSKSFLNILTKISELRDVQEVIPDKDNVFNNFQEDMTSILMFYNVKFENEEKSVDTFYIKENYTSSEGFDHKKLWEPFVMEVNKVLFTNINKRNDY